MKKFYSANFYELYELYVVLDCMMYDDDNDVVFIWLVYMNALMYINMIPKCTHIKLHLCKLIFFFNVSTILIIHSHSS